MEVATKRIFIVSGIAALVLLSILGFFFLNNPSVDVSNNLDELPSPLSGKITQPSSPPSVPPTPQVIAQQEPSPVVNTVLGRFAQTLRETSRVRIAFGITISVLVMALTVGGIIAAVIYRKKVQQLISLGEAEEDANIAADAAKKLAEDQEKRDQLARDVAAQEAAEERQKTFKARLISMLVAFIAAPIFIAPFELLMREKTHLPIIVITSLFIILVGIALFWIFGGWLTALSCIFVFPSAFLLASSIHAEIKKSSTNRWQKDFWIHCAVSLVFLGAGIAIGVFAGF